MKYLRNSLWLLLILSTVSLFSVSCDSEKVNPNPDPDFDLTKNHFDLWVAVAEEGAMSNDANRSVFVKGVNALDKDEIVSFSKDGADIKSVLVQGTIVHGKYYYQVPKEEGRFGKYIIKDGRVNTVAEVPFEKNTYKSEKYTFAWIDKSTLIIAAANGAKDKIIWTKIDADKMKIVEEGEFDLPNLPKGQKFNTSGILKYRESDNQLIYFYTGQVKRDNIAPFHYAFINPKTMKVGVTGDETRAAFMAGTAFGELLQSKCFFDERGDFYLACNTVLEGAQKNTEQTGTMLRIKRDDTAFDTSFEGFRKHKEIPRGKIVTAEYLGSRQALLYIMDPDFTKAKGWGTDYNCYYAVWNLDTDELTTLDLPFSEGNFSQRSIVIGNYAYIGVNPKGSSPAVYVYDIRSGKLTKGATIQEGFAFYRITFLENND